MRVNHSVLLAVATAGAVQWVAAAPARADDDRDDRDEAHRWAERGDDRDLGHRDRYRDDRGDDDGYAVEPYWSYPPEYYIFGGHPSRYYYTYPDRYYSDRYYHRFPPRQRGYRNWRRNYPRIPGGWRYQDYGNYRDYDNDDYNYGYRAPYAPPRYEDRGPYYNDRWRREWEYRRQPYGPGERGDRDDDDRRRR
jgi:hypothetical protein